jgi:RNA polymerase sigma-70 factor (ECF subfamily)
MKREALVSQPGPTDEELLLATAAGEARAFDLLFDRHYRVVFRVAYGVLLDGAEARDVAQEVFARLHQRPEAWSRQAPLRAWLYQVALNEALGVRRRLRAFRRDWQAARASPSPEGAAARRQTVSLLERELHRLAPRQRAVLALHLEADLQPSELAPLLGLTPNHARVLLHRALAQVRERARAAGLELPTDDPRLTGEEA